MKWFLLIGLIIFSIVTGYIALPLIWAMIKEYISESKFLSKIIKIK